MCVDGRWILIAPVIGPGGPIAMAGGPNLTVDAASITVSEGDMAENAGIVTTPTTTPVTLSATLGTVTDLGGALWSWAHTPTDGPAQTETVGVTALAGATAGSDSFQMVVENVAPTVTSVSPDRSAALAGQTVTFAGAATDPSPEDTAAGLAWAFDGTSAAGNTVTRTFSECGSHTVTAVATDKDGGSSAPATSGAVTVTDAVFLSPLRSGAYNVVKAGQVVPVRVEVGCGGTVTTGLSPAITVLKGEVDPGTDADDPAQLVAAVSVSGADTSGVMRPAGSSYLYNLRVPNAPGGSFFTIRVRPYGDTAHGIYAVLRIR